MDLNARRFSQNLQGIVTSGGWATFYVYDEFVSQRKTNKAEKEAKEKEEEEGKADEKDEDEGNDGLTPGLAL